MEQRGGSGALAVALCFPGAGVKRRPGREPIYREDTVTGCEVLEALFSQYCSQRQRGSPPGLLASMWLQREMKCLFI
jgi:hypothetical protein